MEFVIFGIVYIATVVLLVLYFMKREAKLKESEEELVKETRLSILHKLRPHFIFNCLTALGTKCLMGADDPKQISEVDRGIVQFSAYARAMFKLIEGEKINFFPQELNDIRNYFALEQLRFGDKLKFEEDIEITEFYLPYLGVLEFVENAIKHGISKKKEGGTVRLTVKKADENKIRIIIEDDGVGFDLAVLEDSSKCVGINELKSQFEGVSGQVTIESTPGVGTKVEILMPWVKGLDK